MSRFFPYSWNTHLDANSTAESLLASVWEVISSSSRIPLEAIFHSSLSGCCLCLLLDLEASTHLVQTTPPALSAVLWREGSVGGIAEGGKRGENGGGVGLRGGSSNRHGRLRQALPPLLPPPAAAAATASETRPRKQTHPHPYLPSRTSKSTS